MDFDISIDKPEHGWLPVRITMRGESFGFAASDVLNNPVQEMVDGVATLERGEPLKITWWLEPAVYELTTMAEGEGLRLSLHFGPYMDDERREVVASVEVQRESLVAVLKRNCARFKSFGVEEPHWPEVLHDAAG